jgi:hypothetical protein
MPYTQQTQAQGLHVYFPIAQAFLKEKNKELGNLQKEAVDTYSSSQERGTENLRLYDRPPDGELKRLLSE